MRKNTGRHPAEDAYVDGEAAEDVQHDRVHDHALGGGSDGGVSVATRATEPRSDLDPELRTEFPDTVADLPETARLHGRRRRFTITAALLALAVVVALALFVLRPFEGDSAPASTPREWNGDWKDALTEEGASRPYPGDWKDLLAE